MKSILRYFFLSLILSTALISTPTLAHAAQLTTTAVTNNTKQLTTAQQQLTAAQIRNTTLQQKLQSQPSTKKTTTTEPNELQRADLAIALARADLDAINLTLSTVQQTLNLTQANIANLETQLGTPSILLATPATLLQKQLQEQHTLSDLQQARLKILEKTQSIAQQNLVITQEWKTQLQTNYQLHQSQVRQQALEEVTTRLQASQQQWLQRLAQLNEQLQTLGAANLINSPAYARLEISAFEAEERSNLNQIELNQARLHSNLNNLAALTNQNLNLTSLNNAENQINTLNSQVQDMHKILENKIELLQNRSQITHDAIQSGMISTIDGWSEMNLLIDLTANYQNQLDNLNALQKEVEHYHSVFNQQLKEHIASRQTLPGLSLQAWRLLGDQILQIPALTWQRIHSLQKPIIDAVTTLAIWQWIIIALATGVWLILWNRLHHYLQLTTLRLTQNNQISATPNLFSVCLRLIDHYLHGFMLLGGFIGLLMLADIPIQTFNLIIYLAAALLVFGLINGFTRILLLTDNPQQQNHNQLFYRRIKWTLYVGEVITFLTLLVHQLPVAYSVQDLFGRLFMLFILIMALLLVRGWKTVPDIIAPYLENKRRYLKQVVRWLSLLIPLTILSNAVVGLIGYIELAWSMAAYQGLFLIVLTGYLLVRGLLGELVYYLKANMIRNLQNGWLWSEAILRPLYQIIKFLLFCFAIIMLFVLYGWGWQSWVTTNFLALIHTHLFSFADSIITPLSLFELLVTILVLIWIARWTREFTYRWLFANTKDLGLRNSLAIFTQYAFVAIGILIALRIIGINLTALTFIASAFVLGIGFGLRDLANNFISGILLLIERPIRVGDYVTLGGYNGTVVYIGMRSITMTSDDNQEVLVPNSMAFSQSFTNWTHHDNIIRKTLTIKVSRKDDLHHVQNIILDVLKSIPKILTNPAPYVALNTIEDMLINFEVSYYVDMQVSSTSKIRSQLLFALYDRFKAEGIHAPESSYDVNLIQSTEQNIQPTGPVPL